MKALRICDLIGTTVSRTSAILTMSPVGCGSMESCKLQQRPQLADIGHAFELEHLSDELCAFWRAEDWSDQVAGLGNDFVARHGILGSATNVVDAAGEICAVGQLEVQHGHA